MPILLTSARLTLSPLGVPDVTAFVRYRQDPQVARYQSWGVDYSPRDARDLVAQQPPGELPAAGEWLQLGVHDRATGELLGDVALHTLPDQPDSYEIGVTLAPSSQGRGIATEALGILLDHLFDVAGAHRVVASCDTRNHPVAALLTRLGLRRESSQVDADWFKGEWTTLDGYAILARERIRG